MDEQDESVITTLNVTSSCFSFVGSAFIVLCYFQLTEVRSFAFRLVMYVSLSDLCYSVFGFMGDAAKKYGPDSGACIIQAIGIQLFTCYSIAWVTAIAATMHWVLLRGYNPQGPEIHLKHIILVVSGICWFNTLLPLATGSYGDAQGWCWVTDNRNVDITIRFLCFYAWVWMAFLYSLFVFYKVYLKMQEDEREGESASERNRVVKRLKYYPLALVICWFWGSVNRVYQLFGPPLLWLTGLHVWFASLLGAVNAAIYGFNPAVRSALKAHLYPSKEDTYQQNIDEQPNSPLPALVPPTDVTTSSEEGPTAPVR
eukprot:gb/GEZN01012117.1/.p1 GENE.gb/GEZN01012117.1/~~gb/GEZN01012117.1/.p1  ORF type:complete len:313 (+),score=19.80 gb/GEZN01012117.1/:28-966(+)